MKKKLKIITAIIVCIFLQINCVIAGVEMPASSTGKAIFLSPKQVVDTSDFEKNYAQAYKSFSGGEKSGFFDLNYQAVPLTLERLQNLGIEAKTMRNWIWDSTSVSIRRHILTRLATIDNDKLRAFVDLCLFNLNKKLPFGKSISSANVKRIMFKGSYLNNFFEDFVPLEYSLSTDVDLMVVIDSEVFDNPAFLLDFKIPDSVKFVSGKRADAIKSADITFIPESLLFKEKISYSIAVDGYSLIWGSSFELLTDEKISSKDLKPSSNILFDKAFYLIEDALNWISSTGYAKEHDEQIRYSKALKRIVEANCILKYIEEQVDFGEEDIRLIGLLFANYMDKKTQKVFFREQEKHDVNTRRIFLEGFRKEIKNTVTRIELLSAIRKIRGYNQKNIQAIQEKIAIYLRDDVLEDIIADKISPLMRLKQKQLLSSTNNILIENAI